MKSTTTERLGKALLVLPVVGAINWGLVGLFRFNLVETLLRARGHKAGRFASRLIYALVGLSGLKSALPFLEKRAPKELARARWYRRAARVVAHAV